MNELRKNNTEQLNTRQILDFDETIKFLNITKIDAAQKVQLISQKEIGGDDSKILPENKELLEKFKDGELLLSIVDNKIAGYLWYSISDKIADLYEMAISKDYQGQHLGTDLLDKLFNKLKELKVKKLKITATISEDSENKENQSLTFYENYFSKQAKLGAISYSQSGPDNKMFEIDIL